MMNNVVPHENYQSNRCSVCKGGQAPPDRAECKCRVGSALCIHLPSDQLWASDGWVLNRDPRGQPPDVSSEKDTPRPTTRHEKSSISGYRHVLRLVAGEKIEAVFCWRNLSRINGMQGTFGGSKPLVLSEWPLKSPLTERGGRTPLFFSPATLRFASPVRPFKEFG